MSTKQNMKRIGGISLIVMALLLGLLPSCGKKGTTAGRHRILVNCCFSIKTNDMRQNKFKRDMNEINLYFCSANLRKRATIV